MQRPAFTECLELGPSACTPEAHSRNRNPTRFCSNWSVCGRAERRYWTTINCRLLDSPLFFFIAMEGIIDCHKNAYFKPPPGLPPSHPSPPPLQTTIFAGLAYRHMIGRIYTLQLLANLIASGTMPSHPMSLSIIPCQDDRK